MIVTAASYLLASCSKWQLLSSFELIGLVFAIGEGNRSSFLSASLYEQKYKGRRCPKPKPEVLKRLKEELRPQLRRNKSGSNKTPMLVNVVCHWVGYITRYKIYPYLVLFTPRHFRLAFKNFQSNHHVLLTNLLENVPLISVRDMWYQYDGTPS